MLRSGGCLIECDATSGLAAGRPAIDLPGEGWFSVEAETVHPRPHSGVAVTFVT